MRPTLGTTLWPKALTRSPDTLLYAEQAQYHGLQAVDTRHHLVPRSTVKNIAEFSIPTFKLHESLYIGKVRSERSGFRTTFGGRSKIGDFRDHERYSLSDDGLSAHV
ncbi:hypothetical protein C494_01442, partial [Natronorubrum bangense JCM 10635]